MREASKTQPNPLVPDREPLNPDLNPKTQALSSQTAILLAASDNTSYVVGRQVFWLPDQGLAVAYEARTISAS